MNAKIQNLPSSSDEYWEGAEINHFKPVPIRICETHTRERYMEGKYSLNRDGTVSCQYCPWGARLNPKQRLVEGKIVDLVGVSQGI